MRRAAALLSHLVEDAATHTPDHEAVVSGDGRLSSAELAIRVGRIASVLAAVGVERGDRVGVYVHKSVASFAAVHAVLRAGAAYVPIDPNAPASVVAQIVEDCGIDVLISEPRQARQLHEIAPRLRAVVGPAAPIDGVEVIGPDGIEAADVLPITSVLDDDIAYVMYTSGSTGRPKGIVHTHRSGLMYAQLAASTYGLTADDRLANSAPLHFDISTFEVFSGPLAGACTVVIPEPHLKMPASLSQFVADERCTTWYSVPFLLNELVLRGALDQRDLSALRWVIFGGEVIDPTVLAALAPHVPNARFSNSYGPAEVNQCTFHHLEASELADLDGVPIGKPWEGAALRIVDADGSDVPTGEQGELWVRTATMMDRYWGRDDLTASAFAYEPMPGGRTRRWYRTGDLVRQSHDGTVEFCGRRDHQVKVRGNRVELESVESVLAGVDGVDLAIAGIVDVEGTTALAAAVRMQPGESLDATLALKHAASVLPPYAVPFTVIDLRDLPLTPSGKVDRRAVRDQLSTLVAQSPGGPPS
jgi:amino acid adenylation domain-containing protein